MKYAWRFATALSSFLLVGLFFLPLIASAQTNQYYVSPAGSDSNDGSQALPWATLAHANSAFALGASGTVVNVAAGTYAQGASQLNLTRGGSSNSAPVTYRCAATRSCTISSSITGNNTVIQINGNYVRVIGFNIIGTNPAVPNLNTGVYVVGHDVWVKQSTISNIQASCTDTGGGGIAVATGAGSGDVFDSNIVHDIGWANPACKAGNPVHVHGINLESNGPSTATVTNNIIYRVQGGWCIQEQDSNAGSVGTVIANNVMFNCGTGGIAFNETGGTIDHNTVVNNIILNNGATLAHCGIYEYSVSGTHNKYANNDVFGNSGGNYCFKTGSQTGGVSVDPSLGTTFVKWQADGSGDYHLVLRSVAISAGTQACAAGISACAPASDFDGQAFDSPPDIGAFAFAQGAATGPTAPSNLTATIN